MEVYDRLCKARWLIGQCRYAEARALLKTINHAQAAEWLARLDEIEHTPFAHITPMPQRSARWKWTGWRCWHLPRVADIRALLSRVLAPFS